jgi:hypothetical protein
MIVICINFIVFYLFCKLMYGKNLSKHHFHFKENEALWTFQKRRKVFYTLKYIIKKYIYINTKHNIKIILYITLKLKIKN